MTTEERFVALEKTVGMHRIAIAALEKAVNTAVLAAAPQSRDATFDEITVKKLFVYNAAGEQQAVLAVDEEGCGLAINNVAEEVQVILRADEEGGNLAIYDKTGELVRRIP